MQQSRASAGLGVHEIDPWGEVRYRGVQRLWGYLVGLLSDVGCVQEASEHVGDMHQRHKLCLGTQQLPEDLHRTKQSLSTTAQ